MNELIQHNPQIAALVDTTITKLGVQFNKHNVVSPDLPETISVETLSKLYANFYYFRKLSLAERLEDCKKNKLNYALIEDLCRFYLHKDLAQC